MATGTPAPLPKNYGESWLKKHGFPDPVAVRYPNPGETVPEFTGAVFSDAWAKAGVCIAPHYWGTGKDRGKVLTMAAGWLNALQCPWLQPSGTKPANYPAYPYNG